MKRLSEQDMLDRLETMKPGDQVRIKYESGEPPTARAIAESDTHFQRGQPMDVYYGTLEGVKKNAKGEWYVLLFTTCRDRVEDGEVKRGNWRSMNPTTGRLYGFSKVR